VVGEASDLGKLVSGTQGKPNWGLDGSHYSKHISLWESELITCGWVDWEACAALHG